MAIIKCKMCGGDLNLIEGASTAECEYCGTTQTVPLADNEKKLTLFTRANRLRAACEFDKASGVYETIVADFPEEAEAYWGLVLCKFGIEYVDDPATGKKIPTCHRSSFDSVMDDNDLDMTLEYADSVARRVYREEAKAIEEIRKGIIAVSANEQPYDIFICYKETAEDGQRTLDSVLAQDVYDALTDKGYRVFFSRITLEDKLGVEYEPYIFAALNSAKIMLAFGTDYDYYNAVWVKNEWSRFLKLMAKDKEKHLIPCFKGIDAYDMPKEFAKLQAQDLGKVGATQDLLRGIEKLLPRAVAEAQPVMIRQQTAIAGVDTLLRRVFIFLEDGNWQAADEYAEKVLDIDPENAQAYLGKLLGQLRISKPELLHNAKVPFGKNINCEKVLRYGDAQLCEKIKADLDHIVKRNTEEAKQANFVKLVAELQAAQSLNKLVEVAEGFYNIGKDEECAQQAKHGLRAAMKLASKAEEFEKMAEAFRKLRVDEECDRLAQVCIEQAECARKNEIYAKAKTRMGSAPLYAKREAIKLFETIPGWRDSDELVLKCRVMIAEAEQKHKERMENMDKAIWKAGGLCQHCGNEFRGLFNKVCVKCGRPKDY